MEPIILDDLPFEVDGHQLMDSLHVAADSDADSELRVLVQATLDPIHFDGGS